MNLPPLRPDRLPRPLRLAAYAAAVSVLLYLCLAPSEDLPSVSVWDKAEHALSWTVLTGVGLILSPRRPWAIGAFAIGLGLFIELLQATMGFGRDGDWRDLAADTLGTALAVALWALARRRGRRTRPA